jgi:hypothetical protein
MVQSLGATTGPQPAPAPGELLQIAQASQLESLGDHAELWDQSCADRRYRYGGTARATARRTEHDADSSLYQGTPFTGCFDGRGFAIRNLEAGPGRQVSPGVFGKVRGREVRRFRLRMSSCARSRRPLLGRSAGENAGTIEIARSRVYSRFAGHRRTGGLNEGEIRRCFMAGGRIEGSFAEVGGLVGKNENGTITDCYVMRP